MSVSRRDAVHLVIHVYHGPCRSISLIRIALMGALLPVAIGFHGDPVSGLQADEWGDAQELSATREVEHPVYINVAGHFACLLLDDGGPVNVSSRIRVPKLVGLFVDLVWLDLQARSWNAVGHLAFSKR